MDMGEEYVLFSLKARTCIPDLRGSQHGYGRRRRIRVAIKIA
jgi:hypothetical protein